MPATAPLAPRPLSTFHGIDEDVATYCLEHLGGTYHSYTWDEFEARYRQHFGTLTVRQVWAGVVTSAAWHAGQIVYVNRLLPRHLESK